MVERYVAAYVSCILGFMVLVLFVSGLISSCDAPYKPQYDENKPAPRGEVTAKLLYVQH